MKSKRRRSAVLLATTIFLASPGAGAFTLSFTVDENGIGSVELLTPDVSSFSRLNSGLGPDLGPGGQPSVLTYSLAGFGSITPGDLIISQTELGTESDIARFNPPERCPPALGGPCLVFYSDIGPGDVADSLADTPTFPSARYDNFVFLNEIGPEGVFNVAFFAPLEGDPGFIPNSEQTTYTLISDSPAPVPEPASLICLTVAVASLGFARSRRRLVRHQA